jgi:multisubunit Na+/H+ antiporter MnhE subunit
MVYFVWELAVANWQQLRIVLAPRIDVQPHWIHFDTRIESPALRLALGVMISLTPGSLVCDEVEGADGRVCLWIHILDGEDAEATLERIRQRLEAPLAALEAS